jgi:hypothetical protein
MRLDVRPDGSVLLVAEGQRRWGAATAGLGLGGLLLAGMVAGPAQPLETAVMGPVALIAVLAGVAAARHRDWVLLDRTAREISHRRGLPALFRAVSRLPFDDVEAVVLQALGDGGHAVWLDRAGGGRWLVDRPPSTKAAERLVEALGRVGRWPVRRETAA